ncbi:MAG TPA: diguanylate cyclase [Solirubrobacteraceae bacterium]|nr:diguanylate cyclase [Solirubrobacteraceae bacterium]
MPELLEETEALAKAWLLTVLGDAPLSELPARFHPGLAADGPRLCAAIARALASEADLARLGPGGELEPLAARAGRLVGAEGPEATLRGVAALGSVVWEAVRAARPRADGEEVAQLAERLAVVLEPVRRAALRGSEPAPPTPEPEPAPPEFQLESLTSEPEPEPVTPEAELEPVPRDPQPEPATADPGTILWRRALADEVGAALQAGTTLSLLLIELEDASRLVAAQPAYEADRVLGRFTQAVRSIVRRQDILARESESRMWLIARDTSRAGANALGRRAVAAVAASAPWHGAPLGVSVGVAVLGEDARDAGGLIDAAEEAGFAAAAAGTGLDGAGERD